MELSTRSNYANYIAKCIRVATEETGIQWPADTILCVKTYSELAELDEIIGMKIWVMDMPSAYEFFPAFRSENIDCYKLQEVFRENLELFVMDN